MTQIHNKYKEKQMSVFYWLDTMIKVDESVLKR